MIRVLLVFFLVAGSMLLSFFSGSGEIHRWRSASAPPFSLLIEGIAPQKEWPLTEHKSFAIVLVAHNAAPWCERALRSLFEQDYDYFRVLFVDDGSMDGTFERAQEFIVDNGLEERALAMRNETRTGFSASLYRAAEICLDKEIVIPLDASNWLAFEGAISRLNRVFQNPDVWIASGTSVEYPLYRLCEPPSLDAKEIRRKGYQISQEYSFLAFYAGLFKSIRLPDLFIDGKFAESALAWQIPLFEMAGGRCRTLSEPFLFENRAQLRRTPRGTGQAQERSFCRPLAELPLPSLTKESSVDLVLFSYDRPLQLTAALESIQRYLSGSVSCTLLYRSSDTRFDAAYKEVLSLFPTVRAVKQSDHPRKDFKPLLEEILFESPAEYVLFCADDLVMKEYVDLDLCRKALERTGAYAFYLRFGRNIQHSYIGGKPLRQPCSAELGNGMFAWDLRRGEEDWGLANNFEMSLYRKVDLKKCFQKIFYKNPGTLQERWSLTLPEKAVGLYFEQSKLVNLPLNSVQASGKPNMNYMTAEELLLKFNQGLKIDIEPLFQVNNPAPHYDWAPQLISR